MRHITSWLAALAVVVALATSAALTAASLPLAAPEAVGLSKERLHRVHELVERHMKAGEITGAVMLVARKGQVAYVDVAGTMDKDGRRPMRRDSVFRLASMTKPVVGVAVMMMLEEGRLRLDDAVSKYIPEFKGQRVAVLEQAGAAGKPPRFHTVAAERDITIKDLLTHTSGLSSGPMGQSEARKVRRMPTDTLATYIPRLGATPLEFQPGSRWMYSPSDGIDVLARVVEIVSGTPMNVFLKQRIFDPLDMPETSHYPTDTQMPRFVTAYGMADGGMVETQNSLSMSSKVYFAGGGGLVSTVDDYSHFAQMLASGGAFDGKRLLSPRTVRLMASVHVPSTLPGRVAGEGYGLSVRVIENAIAGNHRISNGSFGWSGAYGTHFWVDPVEEIVAVMMIQTPIRPMRPAFENAVMQAIAQ
jgi:CubicO group peptidase (beta-lactamase class C family)